MKHKYSMELSPVDNVDLVRRCLYARQNLVQRSIFGWYSLIVPKWVDLAATYIPESVDEQGRPMTQTIRERILRIEGVKSVEQGPDLTLSIEGEL